jgi:antitoxin component YwqK of YwqJK toxin-antitoxin module
MTIIFKMLPILNNNIIEYVLNEYLDYEEDISKLKQLFLYKFNIKKHLSYKIILLYELIITKSKYVYLNDRLLKIINYYDNRQKHSICNYKNERKNGIYKTWNKNGKLSHTSVYKNGEKHGRFNYYNSNEEIYSTSTFSNNMMTSCSDYCNMSHN